MKINHRFVLKVSLSVLVALGLTACGGGSGGGAGSEAGNNVGSGSSAGSGGSSSDGSSDDAGSGGSSSDGSGSDAGSAGGSNADSGSSSGSSGNGNCVTIPRHVVGEKATIRNIVTLDGNSVETDVTTEYTAVSDTSLSYKSTVDTNLNIDLPDLDLPDGFEIPNLGEGQEMTTTSTFTISNNFMHITKDVTTLLTGTTVTTYSPALTVPIDRVCEGQTWNQNYTSTSTIPGSGVPVTSEAVNVHNIVEAINVSKSAPAGTFTTAQVKASSNGVNGVGDISITSWVDVASGVLVIMETRDGDGNLIGTASLLSK